MGEAFSSLCILSSYTKALYEDFLRSNVCRLVEIYWNFGKTYAASFWIED
jgi:hypothetical protein